MKKYIITLLLIFAFSCKKNSQTLVNNNSQTEIVNSAKENEEAIQTIKNFYLVSYGNEFPSTDENIKKKYLSERILKRIKELTADGENLVLDYDPFIKGQDYDNDVLKSSFEIVPSKNKNQFKVSFLLFGEKGENKTNVVLLLKKTPNGNFLIDSILNDDYLSFKNNINQKQSNNTDGFHVESKGNDLKIIKNDKEKILNSVVINEMSLSTSFGKLDNEKFYLKYENNASMIKSIETYIFSFNSDLKLLSKELVKFGSEGISDNLFLYDNKIIDKSYDYEKLNNLENTIGDSFSNNPIIQNTFKNSKKIHEKKHKNISPEDYFIGKTTFK